MLRGESSPPGILVGATFTPNHPPELFFKIPRSNRTPPPTAEATPGRRVPGNQLTPSGHGAAFIVWAPRNVGSAGLGILMKPCTSAVVMLLRWCDWNKTFKGQRVDAGSQISQANLHLMGHWAETYQHHRHRVTPLIIATAWRKAVNTSGLSLSRRHVGNLNKCELFLFRTSRRKNAQHVWHFDKRDVVGLASTSFRRRGESDKRGGAAGFALQPSKTMLED